MSQVLILFVGLLYWRQYCIADQGEATSSQHPIPAYWSLAIFVMLMIIRLQPLIIILVIQLIVNQL